MDVVSAERDRREWFTVRHELDGRLVIRLSETTPVAPGVAVSSAGVAAATAASAPSGLVAVMATLTKPGSILLALAGAAVGGIAVVAMTKREPASLRWYGYQIQVESRGLDEASAGGKPLRWSVSLDDQILASGLAQTHPLAVDAAKSAIEQLAESMIAAPSTAEITQGVV